MEQRHEQTDETNGWEELMEESWNESKVEDDEDDEELLAW